jgi:hypothetical protein
MKLTSAVGGGIAGAVVLTVVHETVRRLDKDAPRMDLLGMEALEKTLRSVEAAVPREKNLFKLTMLGDIISNSLYYTFAGIGGKKQAILRGSLLGLAAGAGAVYLPKHMSLHDAPSNRTLQTKLMTIALYTLGGLVAGTTGKIVENRINQ